MEDYEKEEGKVDTVPPAAGFAMDDALAEFEVAQAEEEAEQQAILESIQSEVEVAANRRYLCEADVELEELFADMESDKEPELRASANDQEASPSGTSGTKAVDISDDE